ncbi:PP2C family protein-serine/threonine phosphatase [Sphaerisporangium sp. TRM90804]|uniref:PP2C family protein-serine/threonine phosphatase n=1 Tax=Sphaerisporangium sp. TRM90804 TaxID=3031113 RepID=UPI002449EB90|nr:PP2C family protein-serine/threonine phosphatase [Sphaerisporangium sp. TRM90804]MDH2429760.1 PP2C family protein-serine/threonine phosphatase [Sphaerisporangium sp. TRM90804]
MSSRPAPLIPPRLRAILVRIPFLVPIVRFLRRGPLARDRNLLITLSVLTLLLGVLAARVSTEWFSPSLFILVTLVGGLQLRLRSLAVLLGAVCVALGYVAVVLGVRDVGPGMLVTLGFTMVLALLMARTRGKLGVQGLRGDVMLLELRDRLKRQGDLPALPKDWGHRVVLKQAGGSSFGGDFLVSTRNGPILEVALVDVSGKGVDAGTRALMLSGTFGGLLGSVESFLPACNAYLHRQPEGEGFVTAVHLRLDLSTGAYVITSAGHPPVVKFDAGRGTWQVSAAKGVVLGVVPDLHCEPDSGVLRRGDALMLYTDGLIEQPGRDIDSGLDRLLGEAERLVPSGFHDGARPLVNSMSAGHNDDCALILIWRP